MLLSEFSGLSEYTWLYPLSYQIYSYPQSFFGNNHICLATVYDIGVPFYHNPKRFSYNESF